MSNGLATLTMAKKRRDIVADEHGPRRSSAANRPESKLHETHVQNSRVVEGIVDNFSRWRRKATYSSVDIAVASSASSGAGLRNAMVALHSNRRRTRASVGWSIYSSDPAHQESVTKMSNFAIINLVLLAFFLDTTGSAVIVYCEVA